MSKKCSVCDSRDKKKIERELLKGTSYVAITRMYGVGPNPLSSHKKKHMSVAITDSMISRIPSLKVKEIDPNKEIPHLKDVEACLIYLHQEFHNINNKAKESDELSADNFRASSIRMQALRHDMDLIGMLLKGKDLIYENENQLNWKKILPKIVEATEDYPEVSFAIAEVLRKSQYIKTAEEILLK